MKTHAYLAVRGRQRERERHGPALPARPARVCQSGRAAPRSVVANCWHAADAARWRSVCVAAGGRERPARARAAGDRAAGSPQFRSACAPPSSAQLGLILVPSQISTHVPPPPVPSTPSPLSTGIRRPRVVPQGMMRTLSTLSRHAFVFAKLGSGSQQGPCATKHNGFGNDAWGPRGDSQLYATRACARISRAAFESSPTTEMECAATHLLCDDTQ